MKRPLVHLGAGALLCLSTLLVSCSPGLPTLEQASELPPWLLGPAVSLATLSSEDITCIGSGIMASQGVWSYSAAVFWCWLGILVGDVGLYMVGRIFGERSTRLPLLRRVLTPARLKRGGQLFDRHGILILFLTRFMPGTRTAAYVGAGMTGYSLAKFAFFLALAGGLWTPVLVGLAMKSGEVMTEWMRVYENWALPIFVGVILFIWLLVKLIVPLFTWKGRRLLLSGWFRFREWEFWPMWAVYPPVLTLLLRLWIWNRGVPAFASCNPAMPCSGLAMESKSAILRGLCGGRESDPRVGRFLLIPLSETLEQKLERVARFQETLEEPWPIVLKPDIGERGQGVGILRSEDEVRAFAETCREDFIVQEYLPGEEFGVFYYRFPGEVRGQISSITHKQLLVVTGDGESNLERLILQHPRAVRMAEYFLKRHDERLDEVPAAGEKIRLGDLGTHCRGALFLDGREHLTDALLKSVDELSQQYEGFYLGRYDLRAHSVEDLRAGRNLKVLELNGVSSEPTHIYQPGYSLFRAWGELRQQWRIAWEIGQRNIARGEIVWKNREILRLVRQHRKQDWHEVS